MPDSSNGHSNAPHPLVRPPSGERAARGAFDAPVENATEPEGEAVVPVEEAPVFLANGRPIEDVSHEPLEPVAYSPGGDFGGGPPLGLDEEGGASGSGDPNTPNDVELGLIEHLGELRKRILYCFMTVGAAMILTYAKTTEIQAWFSRPIFKALQGSKTPGVPGIAAGSGNEPIITDPTGAFTLYLQVSAVSALIITMPFVLFQIWRFVEPALTKSERRYTLVLVPFASALFFLGIALGYYVSPMFYQFFLQFQPPGVAAKWDYLQAVVLLAKMLLVFGIAFQVPVITIFLNKSGLVSRNLLIEYWRHAVVVIFAVIAVLTPTWDPLTLTVCATPPCLLYLLSIWLVKWL